MKISFKTMGWALFLALILTLWPKKSLMSREINESFYDLFKEHQFLLCQKAQLEKMLHPFETLFLENKKIWLYDSDTLTLTVLKNFNKDQEFINQNAKNDFLSDFTEKSLKIDFPMLAFSQNNNFLAILRADGFIDLYKDFIFLSRFSIEIVDKLLPIAINLETLEYFALLNQNEFFFYIKVNDLYQLFHYNHVYKKIAFIDFIAEPYGQNMGLYYFQSTPKALKLYSQDLYLKNKSYIIDNLSLANKQNAKGSWIAIFDKEAELYFLVHTQEVMPFCWSESKSLLSQQFSGEVYQLFPKSESWHYFLLE